MGATGATTSSTESRAKAPKISTQDVTAKETITTSAPSACHKSLFPVASSSSIVYESPVTLTLAIKNPGLEPIGAQREQFVPQSSPTCDDEGNGVSDTPVGHREPLSAVAGPQNGPKRARQDRTVHFEAFGGLTTRVKIAPIIVLWQPKTMKEQIENTPKTSAV